MVALRPPHDSCSYLRRGNSAIAVAVSGKCHWFTISSSLSASTTTTTSYRHVPVLQPFVFALLILLLVVPLVDDVRSDALADGTWLAALYNATNGPNWTSTCSTNWNITNPGSVCSSPVWSKVTCNATGISGVVIYVDLSGCGLQGGPLPDIVGTSLAYCTYLWLYSNTLTGTVPSSFSSLSSLRQLYLHTNSLTGTLPSSFGNMPSLQTLYLHSNSLTGSLPSSFSNMTSLQHLFVHTNSLSGSLPSSFSSLSSLAELHLFYNSLTGTLPSSFSSLSSLWVVYLFSNSLVGTLPSSWYSLKPGSPSWYDFSNNYLTGDIPVSWLWNFATIDGIYFQSNCLNVSNMTAVTETGRFPDASTGLPWSNTSVCAAVAAAQARSSMSSATRSSAASVTAARIMYAPQSKSHSRSTPSVMATTVSATISPSVSVTIGTSRATIGIAPVQVARANLFPRATQSLALVASVAAASSSAAFVLQRSALVLRLLSCEMSLDDVPDTMTSPTQMQIGDSLQRYQRGTVIGNLCILVGIATSCVFVCFAQALRFRRRDDSAGGETSTLFLWRLAASMHLPGVLVIFWSVLLQPLVAAIACLLLLQPAAAIDLAIGLAGLSAVGLVVAVEVRLILFRFRASWTRRTTSDVEKKDCAGLSLPTCWDLSDEFGWQDDKEELEFVKHYGMVFESYRPGTRRCFHLVDSLFAIVSAMVQAVATVFSDSTTSMCSGEVLLYVMCVLQATYFLMVALWRPQAETSEYIKAAVMSCLGAISALLAVIPTCAEDWCGSVAVEIVQIQVYLALVDMCVGIAAALWSGRFQRFVVSLIAPSCGQARCLRDVVVRVEEAWTVTDASHPVDMPGLVHLPPLGENVDPARLVVLAELIERICLRGH